MEGSDKRPMKSQVRTACCKRAVLTCT